MRWDERLAYKLLKPRNPPFVRYVMLAVSGVLVLWGVAVCVIIVVAPIAAIIDLRETLGWLKAAENSFDFWNNEEDAVYDTL